ncbi:hypothetical protein CORC01_08053 [Colletotrichum orchidophilum]|uniref:Uncharacterized protein n=1 Tax=Colletotrichum orchidophilum TaxID=1209926 RepID=A0A1G4B5J0_9PEZI|nr:uncharacterized protein CORC01_08053 [Colletotrichum orchidophilum]OHE96596.1 hypothetical protein CORC01_08053 [Colletotrichum orchidophilum]
MQEALLGTWRLGRSSSSTVQRRATRRPLFRDHWDRYVARKSMGSALERATGRSQPTVTATYCSSRHPRTSA